MKIRNLGMMIVSVIMIFLILTGCGDPNTNETTTLSNQENEMPSIPKMVRFESEAEYQELANAMSLSDDALKAFLESTDHSCHYAMNGITNREELFQFLSFVEKMQMHMIQFQDISYNRMIVYLDDWSLDTMYTVDEITYRFTYSIVDENSDTVISKRYEHIKQSLWGEEQDRDETVTVLSKSDMKVDMVFGTRLAQALDGNEKAVPTYMGAYIEDDVLVNIMLTNPQSEKAFSLDLLQALIFERFDKVEKK